jgi:hypothetical protein
MREFDSGATRDSDDSKLDYDGFLSPYTLRRYAEYMDKHRIQADGKPRDSDNWQKGIPFTAYIKSLWRHLIEAWTLHRSGGSQVHYLRNRYEMEEALCAIIFNASGYLHEMMKPNSVGIRIFTSTPTSLNVFHEALRRRAKEQAKGPRRDIVEVKVEGRTLRFYTPKDAIEWLNKTGEKILGVIFEEDKNDS